MTASDPASAGRNGLQKRGTWRALGAAIACALVASCSSSSDFATQLGFADGVGLPSEDAAASDTLATLIEASAAPAPSPRPETGQEAHIAEAAPAEEAAGQKAAVEQTAEDEAEAQQTQVAAAVEEASAEEPADAEPAEASADPAEDAADELAKKRSFLSAFFSSSQKPSAQPRTGASALQAVVEAAEPEMPAAEEEEPEKPTVLASAEATPVRASFSGDALPGVRGNDQLFEIFRKSDTDDVSDVDLYEGVDSYQVASAAGLARLAPNGLLKQRESVDVSCFKPGLMRILKTIERHYGKPVLVTSGYRSPEHNRRVRGARNSMHMYCAAADIQLDGVSKWELARFVRALPGRGGVGTYCHTSSVHVDVGPERDWNWRCGRRR